MLNLLQPTGIMGTDNIKLKRYLFIGLGLIGIMVIISSAIRCQTKNNSMISDTISAEPWTCLVHPQVRKHEGGICPVCNRRLIVMKQNPDKAPSRLQKKTDFPVRTTLQTTTVRTTNITYNKKSIQALMIPVTAPVFIGHQPVVYVEILDSKNNPSYQARVVHIGLKIRDYYPVMSGLTEGERVVIQGRFTVGSGLNIINNDIQGLLKDGTSSLNYEAIAVSRKNQKHLQMIVLNYLDFHHALVEENEDEVKIINKRFKRSLFKLSAKRGTLFYQVWKPLSQHIKKYTGHIAKAKTLDMIRQSFHGISKQIAIILHVFGNPLNETVLLFSCPDAFWGEGGLWLQKERTRRNPYGGSELQHCGTIHRTIPQGAYMSLIRGDGLGLDHFGHVDDPSSQQPLNNIDKLKTENNHH